jgi:3'-phosphoadenosine 5'-phosphosulfate (PAPS) 3'-phosphatase
MIRLKNGHLYIDAPVVQQAFGDDPQVSVVYYPERQTLLVAGKSKAFFEKMHETNWVVLKDRNLLGDKTVYLREILIDHDLDDTDRDLEYTLKTTGILTVTL